MQRYANHFVEKSQAYMHNCLQNHTLEIHPKKCTGHIPPTTVYRITLLRFIQNLHWTQSPHNCLQNHTLEFGAIPIYLPKPSTKLGSGCYPKFPGSQNTLQNQALSKMVVNQAFMQPFFILILSTKRPLQNHTHCFEMFCQRQQLAQNHCFLQNSKLFQHCLWWAEISTKWCSRWAPGGSNFVEEKNGGIKFPWQALLVLLSSTLLGASGVR